MPPHSTVPAHSGRQPQRSRCGMQTLLHSYGATADLPHTHQCSVVQMVRCFGIPFLYTTHWLSPESRISTQALCFTPPLRPESTSWCHFETGRRCVQKESLIASNGVSSQTVSPVLFAGVGWMSLRTSQPCAQDLQSSQTLSLCHTLPPLQCGHAVEW